MTLKPDQERVKNLLTDTVTLLCKNGLTFTEQLKVEAVIGVTVDQDVFIVHVNETYKNPDAKSASSADVQVSDVPPPGVRDKDRQSSSQRRRQREDYVDLTGRETPRTPSSSSVRSAHPAHPPARFQPRPGVAPPASPSRRSQYGNNAVPPRASNIMPGQMNPITPSQRMRMGTMQPAMQGGMVRQRYTSPHPQQHIRQHPQQQQQRGYGPRPQQFVSAPNQHNSRRRGAPDMARGVRPPMPPPAAPARAKRTATGEEVIVLDEPSTNTAGKEQAAPPAGGRIIGSVTASPLSTAASPPAGSPTTVEPVTIEPEATSLPSTAPSGTASPGGEETGKSPTTTDSAPVPTTSVTSATDNEQTTVNVIEPHDSPSEGSPPSAGVGTEAPSNGEDTLGPLGSVPEDQQTAQVDTPVEAAVGERTSPEDVSVVSLDSPGVPSEASLAALEEVAKNAVEEVEKMSTQVPDANTTSSTPDEPAKDHDALSLSDVETIASVDQSAESNGVPTLSVSSIQGNYERYESLGTMRPLKRQPSDEQDEEPTPKKRAMSSSSDAASMSDSNSFRRNGDDASADGGDGSHSDVASCDGITIKTESREETNKSLTSKSCRKTEKCLSRNEVRELIEKHIVSPVLKKQESTVTAFRLFWRGTQDEVKQFWKDIVSLRKEIDDIVAQEQSLSFFISSITVENAPAASFPCIGYWVVSRHPQFQRESFVQRVEAASHGAFVRRVLRVDAGTMDEFGALCLMLKDYGEGMIQKKIAECVQDRQEENHPTVRFILKENFFEHMLKNAMKHLRSASFTASLEKVM